MPNSVSAIISDDLLNRIIQIESAGLPTAKAGTSSATGLGQFINATWLAIVAKYRPDLLTGKTTAGVLALRTSPSIAVEMLARFTEDNARGLGSGWTGGDLYLAHFLGLGAARNLLRAAPATATHLLVGAAQINANKSILQGKTAGDVRAWAARRMAASGGKDWVHKYYVGKVNSPIVEKAKDAAITGGAIVVGGAATHGASTGWPLLAWIILAAVVVVGAVAGFLLLRYLRRSRAEAPVVAAPEDEVVRLEEDSEVASAATPLLDAAERAVLAQPIATPIAVFAEAPLAPALAVVLAPAAEVVAVPVTPMSGGTA